ncbi:MAG TPA: XRE family transcriptional regulator [Gammaproteobacteria bacterium]|nr:XRE family transcriptional regulator [Gammaproteobacteria bacterium]
MSHSDLKQKALARASVLKAFEELEPEFQLLREMLKARKAAGLSQAEVASRMGTKAPAVARLESSLTSGQHSPSITTLKKYARAVGRQLDIRLVHGENQS